MTLDHLALAEKEYGHKLNVKKFTPNYPVDYPVVDLGIDADIQDTGESLKAAEKQLKTKWGQLAQ